MNNPAHAAVCDALLSDVPCRQPWARANQQSAGQEFSYHSSLQDRQIHKHTLARVCVQQASGPLALVLSLSCVPPVSRHCPAVSRRVRTTRPCRKTCARFKVSLNPVDGNTGFVKVRRQHVADILLFSLKLSCVQSHTFSISRASAVSDTQKRARRISLAQRFFGVFTAASKACQANGAKLALKTGPACRIHRH